MDLKKLIKSLNDHKVRFVIIGAEAFAVHGYARATFDIDIFIDPTIDNAKHMVKALIGCGYTVIKEVTIQSILEKKTLIRQYVLPVDIHPFVKGVSFRGIWKNKIKSKIGKQYVFFPSLNDIIKMKKAAGRPKDIEDLKYLSRLEQLKKKRKS